MRDTARFPPVPASVTAGAALDLGAPAGGRAGRPRAGRRAVGLSELAADAVRHAGTDFEVETPRRTGSCGSPSVTAARHLCVLSSRAPPSSLVGACRSWPPSRTDGAWNRPPTARPCGASSSSDVDRPIDRLTSIETSRPAGGRQRLVGQFGEAGEARIGVDRQASGRRGDRDRGPLFVVDAGRVQRAAVRPGRDVRFATELARRRACPGPACAPMS